MITFKLDDAATKRPCAERECDKKSQSIKSQMLKGPMIKRPMRGDVPRDSMSYNALSRCSNTSHL